MALTPFTPLALKPSYHVFFIAVCCAIFALLFYFNYQIAWIFWMGGFFLGVVGGFLQIWSVEEVIHSRRGEPSWKEFLHLLEHTRWGKGYIFYFLTYIGILFYLGHNTRHITLEDAIVDFLSFVMAKEIVTLPERFKLQKAFSFKERRFEWARLPRYRETPFRRFVRRWFHFV